MLEIFYVLSAKIKPVLLICAKFLSYHLVSSLDYNQISEVFSYLHSLSMLKQCLLELVEH